MDQEAIYASEIAPTQFGMEPEPEALPRSPEIDYNISFSEEKRARLARRITSQYTQYLNATDRRRENCKRWRRDWDLYPSDTHNEPWSKASNIPGADTRRTCNAHHTRLNQQILMLDPPFAVVALEDEAIQAVPLIEEAIPAFLEQAEWQIQGDRLHQELPKIGNCFLSVTYDIEKKWKPFYEGDVDENLARTLVTVAGQAPHEAGFEALRKDAQGRVMKKLAFREEVVYQGVRLRVINWEDALVLPVTVRNADEACGKGERVLVMGEVLARGAKEGRYIKEAVESLLKQPPDTIDDDFMEALDIQGIDGTSNSESDYYTPEGYHGASLYHQYLLIEMCYLLDVKDDGRLIWCWVTVHPATETLLRLQYLPWEHGECHYHHFPYLERTGQLWAQGVAEMIAGHQDARSAAWNQQIDYADLAIRIATTLFVDESSAIDPDEFELELGQINLCENVNGIKQLIIPQLPAEHAMLPDLLKNEIDLLTGATDPMMGKTAGGNPTLGEVQIAVGSGNIQFENAAAAVARRWKQVWDQVRWLYAQFGEGEEIKYRKAPMPAARIQFDEQGNLVPQSMTPPPVAEFGTITSQVLRAKVDLVPAGLQHMSDIQTRIQQAQVTWREVTTNPLIAPLLAANPRLLMMAFDYYLQQLRVPIRRQFMQEMGQTIHQMAAQAAAQQQAEQAKAAGALGAETAGVEAAIQAQMADQGMMGSPAGAVPTNGAGPPMAVVA